MYCCLLLLVIALYIISNILPTVTGGIFSASSKGDVYTFAMRNTVPCSLQSTDCSADFFASCELCHRLVAMHGYLFIECTHMMSSQTLVGVAAVPPR